MGVCTLNFSWFADSQASAEELLTVGSKAPTLNIEHWISQGRGNFKPVSKFENGKVYVVEFWATWCGPCIQGMPHLAKLQKEYAEKGVQIIGVSSEDLETVQEFLKREVPKRGNEKESLGATFGELTSNYSLTCDPDESTDKAYMRSAYQDGIPTAFVVGKSGTIEWIGHPSEMDDVLREVVNDTWNREAFGKRFTQLQRSNIAKAQLNEALQKRDFVNAVKLIDARIADSSDPQERVELQLTKVQIALTQNKVEEAAQLLQECYAGTKSQVALVDMISWHIYEQSEQRRLGLLPLVKIAMNESEKALSTAKGESRGSLLDTAGHLAYKLGNLEKAILFTREATTFAAGENKEFSKQFLDVLLKEQAAKDKK